MAGEHVSAEGYVETKRKTPGVEYRALQSIRAEQFQLLYMYQSLRMLSIRPFCFRGSFVIFFRQ